MTSVHKTYAPEFKLELARLVVDQGLRITDVMATTKIDRTHHHRRGAAGVDPTGQGHPCRAPAWRRVRAVRRGDRLLRCPGRERERRLDDGRRQAQADRPRIAGLIA